MTLFRKQYKELIKVHGLNRTLNKEKTSELVKLVKSLISANSILLNEEFNEISGVTKCKCIQ